MFKKVSPLKFTSLSGITMDQIIPHHGVLYTGYVNKVSEIEAALRNADPAKANGTYSELGELKRQEIFATNGAILHEKYFDNLGGDGAPGGAPELGKAIAAKWGSFEAWLADFKASGIAARGWVVLAYNLEDGELHNYSSDTHDHGGVWSCLPILVLDVYEHAYFFDFKTARKDYIEAFMRNVDWKEANSRYVLATKLGK